MNSFVSLLLDMNTGLAAGLFVVFLIVGLGIGGVVTWFVLKQVSKKKNAQKLDETSQKVEEMLAKAKDDCKQLKRETILEAKEQKKSEEANSNRR